MTIIDDTHVEPETARLAAARSRLRFDRWDMPRRRPGCAADHSHLGWVPGVAYRTWTGTDVCVGYGESGEVFVRNEAGEVRSHRTAVTQSDHAIADTWTRSR